MLVFPAWAGVILKNVTYALTAVRVPRMGGGDPKKRKEDVS